MFILFVRHGQSTANLLQKSDPLYLLKLLFHPDAKLSDSGLEQSRIMSDNIINMLQLKGLDIVPLIFTSILTRAIQTANYISKFAHISKGIDLRPVVLPYIEEIPLTYGLPINIPIDLQNQPRTLYELLEENFSNYEDDDLNFDVIPELNPYDRDGNVILRVSIEKFFESLELIKEYIIESGYKLTKNSVIIIISHRKTIKEITGLSVGNLGLVLQKDIYNNEILFDGF